MLPGITNSQHIALALPAFVPTDIAGCQGWWRMDSGVTGVTPVTAVLDQSGNGRTLSDASLGPIWGSSEVNGQPALKFDGSNDRLLTADFTLAMPYHWFLVGANLGWTDTDVFAYGDNDNANNNAPQIMQRNSSDRIVARANNVDSSFITLTTGVYGVIDALFTTGSSASHIRLNNGSKATGTFTSISMDGLVLGSRFNDRPGNVGIAEFIIYDSEITGTDLTNLMSYFTARYAIP